MVGESPGFATILDGEYPSLHSGSLRSMLHPEHSVQAPSVRRLPFRLNPHTTKLGRARTPWCGLPVSFAINSCQRQRLLIDRPISAKADTNKSADVGGSGTPSGVTV
jgi:hypothetical protein